MSRQLILDMVYPVGFVIFTASAENPSISIGGAWERYAQGKCLFGVDDADTDFALGTTGGEKTNTLAIQNIPSHTHTFDDKIRLVTGWGSGGGSVTIAVASETTIGNETDPAGGDGNEDTTPINNLPPYIAIYIWKRTA